MIPLHSPLALAAAVGCLLARLSLAAPAGGPVAGPPPPDKAAVAQVRAHAEQAALEALRKGEKERAFLILSDARDHGLPAALYYMLRAEMYAALGDGESEEAQLRGAIHEDPKLTEAIMRLAVRREQHGLWREAAALYQQALDVDPGQVQAYLDLSDILLGEKRVSAALEVLARGLKAVPQDGRLPLALAEAYESQGDRRKALEHYRRAAALLTGEQRTRALLKSADISLAHADFATAFGYYREAVAEKQPVTVALYGRMMTAADAAAWGAFTPAWAKLDAYLKGAPGALAREDVYAAVTRAGGEVGQVVAFGDRVEVPAEVKSVHARRRFVNSLLAESLANALSYLDTGDAETARNAAARRADALEARKMLPPVAGGKGGS